MKLTDLKEDKKMQFWIEPSGPGFDVLSVDGGHHDHYDTREEAETARDELNRKYNRDPHLK